jgi:hypothetical protein
LGERAGSEFLPEPIEDLAISSNEFAFVKTALDSDVVLVDIDERITLFILEMSNR